MADYLKKRPMLLCGLCASALCIAGFYSRVAVFFLGLALIFVFYFLIQKNAKQVYALIVFMLFAISVSILSTYKRIDKLNELDGITVQGSFAVIEKPVDHDSFYSSVVKAIDCQGLKSGTRIMVFFNEKEYGFEYGDKINATVNLKKIDGKYKGSDYSDKIYLTGNMKNITVYSGEGGFILSVVKSLRGYISDTLFSNMEECEAATLTAMTVGDRSYLSDEFTANLKAAGVSHIMVVSGMHLAIIVTLATGFIEKFFYNRYLKAVTVLLTVLFMSALCGFTKSIVRAGLCYIIYAVSIVLERDNTPENTLGAAVALILTAEPFAIFSVSFQLSVLSTLGITAVARPVIGRLKEKLSDDSLIMHTAELAIVSLSAMLFTMPLTVWLFGYISTVTVVTNILLSFAVTLSIYFTAAGLVIFPAFPLGGQVFLIAASLVIKYVNFVINKLGSLPFSVLTVGKYGFMFSLLLLFSVIFVLFACKRRRDMLKLREMHEKIISEGGGKLKWR